MTIFEALRSVTTEIKTWTLSKLSEYVANSKVGAASGVAPLDASSKLPTANLPDHSHDADDLPAATTTAIGVTKLVTSVTSTDETTAATPAAVKTAYDKGVSAAGAATAAQSAATDAQSAAEEAANAAKAAQSTADTAKTNAATAQSTADTAKTNAATAQSTADTAKTNAATAQSAAETAASAAQEAKEAADQAQDVADQALNKVEPISRVTGSVGQVIVISEVDENGIPTSYASATLKSGQTISTFENVMLGNLMKL